MIRFMVSIGLNTLRVLGCNGRQFTFAHFVAGDVISLAQEEQKVFLDAGFWAKKLLNL